MYFVTLEKECLEHAYQNRNILILLEYMTMFRTSQLTVDEYRNTAEALNFHDRYGGNTACVDTANSSTVT